MADDRPDPLSDTLKGLGLLFRAARTVVSKIPTKDLEEAVATSAREVGRAIKSVATTLEREVLGKKSARASAKPPESNEPPSGDSTDPKPRG